MRLALASCTGLPEWEVDDRPLHDALRAMGHEVHTPPWDADVAWSSFDGVLIRTTWDYTGRRDAFVAWCRGLEVPLHNPAEVVSWNTHKGYLRDLEERGVPILPTVWLEKGTDPAVSVPTNETFPTTGPLFLKPCIGATAQGTARFPEGWGDEALRWARGLLADGDAMLQPYMARVGSEGERSAIAIDGTVTHWVRKVPRPGDYRVQDDHGATDHPHHPTELERRLVDQTLAALPPGLLYARIDWLLDDDGQPRINEVELVEPSLFFRHGAHAATSLAEAWIRRLQDTNG
jgi:hypothetical protein